jgi:methanogenic corrinoid protein MtbC1
MHLQQVSSNKNNRTGTKTKILNNENLELYISQSLTIILMALQQYNLDIISNELEKLKQRITPNNFAFKIILPIMSGLGLAVGRGEFSITHEHALSAIVKFHIGHFLYQQPLKLGKKINSMIICGIEGDYHEFGILISALLALEAGFKIIYLGSHMPADSLADAVNSINPNYVVVGATSIVENFGRNYLEKYIHKLDLKMNSLSKIIIGSSLNFTSRHELNHQVIHLRTLREFNHFVEKKHILH